MNVTFQNYQTLAMRTAKLLPTLDENLNHAALGVASEVLELLDSVEEGGPEEELGDVMWYVALACHHLGVQFADLVPVEVGEADPDQLIGGSCRFISSVKRLVIYGLPIESLHDLLVADLGLLVLFAHNVLPETGSTLDEVLAGNIAKLQKRYPDKYSDLHAEARLDKDGADCRNS